MADQDAKRRLEQLSSHVTPGESLKDRITKRSRRKDDEPPADWSDVLAQLNHVRRLAKTPKTETTGYQRHKQAGKLWVRERIDLLLDPGTFREVGSAAGTATWVKPDGVKRTMVDEERESVADFTPSNNVQGMSVSQ